MALTQAAERAALNKIIDYLDEDPEKNIDTIMTLVDKFVPEYVLPSQRRAFDTAIRERNNWYRLMMRIFDLNPEVRTKLLKTLIVDCTGSAPFSSSSKLVNAYHQLAPSAVRMARSCICSLPKLGSTATTSWPCSFMRRRIKVRVWASCSCVGSCCRAATACSIFSLPFRPLSLG